MVEVKARPIRMKIMQTNMYPVFSEKGYDESQIENLRDKRDWKESVQVVVGSIRGCREVWLERESEEAAEEKVMLMWLMTCKDQIQLEFSRSMSVCVCVYAVQCRVAKQAPYLHQQYLKDQSSQAMNRCYHLIGQSTKATITTLAKCRNVSESSRSKVFAILGDEKIEFL